MKVKRQHEVCGDKPHKGYLVQGYPWDIIYYILVLNIDMIINYFVYLS